MDAKIGSMQSHGSLRPCVTRTTPGWVPQFDKLLNICHQAVHIVVPIDNVREMHGSMQSHGSLGPCTTGKTPGWVPQFDKLLVPQFDKLLDICPKSSIKRSISLMSGKCMAQILGPTTPAFDDFEKGILNNFGEPNPLSRFCKDLLVKNPHIHILVVNYRFVVMLGSIEFPWLLASTSTIFLRVKDLNYLCMKICFLPFRSSQHHDLLLKLIILEGFGACDPRQKNPQVDEVD